LCVAFPVLLALAFDLTAETLVYRCTTPGGGVEFRQHPCGKGTDGQEVTVEDRKTGWIPPEAPEVQSEKKANDTAGSKPKAGKRGDAASSKARREEQCWKKRQLLEEVNWKLRRGYKPSKGVALRRKRRTYEEYIARFCE
jgi:hypothetical protein